MSLYEATDSTKHKFIDKNSKALVTYLCYTYFRTQNQLKKVHYKTNIEITLLMKSLSTSTIFIKFHKIINK